MNEDAAAQGVAGEHRESATADTVAFVGPVEGQLDRRLRIALGHPVVEPGFDGDEAHAAQAVTFEREVRRTEQVEVVGRPSLHLGNPPVAHEWPAGRGVSSRHP